MVTLLFSYYWRVSLLKDSPENTPYSIILMWISAVLLAVIMVIQWVFSDVVFGDDISITVMCAISLILSFFIYTYALLFVTGYAARFVQTITCLFVIHAIIHILASPLLLLDPYLSQANLKNPLLLFIGVIYLFVTLGLSVWQFVIAAHIFKYALNTTAIQSVLAAFGLIAVNILTVSLWR